MNGSAGRALPIFLALLLLTVGSPAKAQERFDPNLERMAVADRVTTAGFQARVWTETIAGRLATRNLDAQVNGWTTFDNITGISSGIDVAYVTDITIQRQRVFYVRGGVLRMLNFDNDVFVMESSLPAAPNALATDVATAVFTEFSTLKMAVAVATTAGEVCVYEASFTGSFPSPTCTATSWGGRDGDGSVAPGDCDDADPARGDNLPEIVCDGIDNDCRSGDCCTNDEDGDGFACRDDCDDTNQLIHPGADTPPGCYRRDMNCDGRRDGVDC